MAKKAAPKTPTAPTTTQVMKRIQKTRDAIMASQLARATKPDRSKALKKEDKPVKPPA